MPAKHSYYWDTCIFIAWIQDEGIPPRKPGEMDGLAEVVDEIDKGHATLITSALTYTEVLASTLNSQQQSNFSLMLKRPSSFVLNVDIRVSQLASQIRDYYKQSHINLKTPDAIHLASALITKASAFHTFEDGLLRLTGNVAGHNLTISKPLAAQTVMRF